MPPTNRGKTTDPTSYTTLSALLAVTPTGYMVATALDAPGSLLAHDGAGKWLGTLGEKSIAFASLPALTLIADGTVAVCPQLLGTGVFRVRAGGSRWACQMGQSPISDSGTNGVGYAHTATGTSLVVIASADIPAGFIGLSEGWELWVDLINGTFVSGSDVATVRFQSGGAALATASANNTGRVGRGEGVFYRRPSNVLQRYSSGRTYSGQSTQDVTLDLSIAQILEACLTPGAVNNVDTIRGWGITRFA